MEKRCLKATVHGVVQGVCFRYYTRKTAAGLGLTGWVKNQPDGTVALAAFGDATDLGALEAWLHRGPAHARVIRVDATFCEDNGDFTSFDITY